MAEKRKPVAPKKDKPKKQTAPKKKGSIYAPIEGTTIHTKPTNDFTPF